LLLASRLTQVPAGQAQLPVTCGQQQEHNTSTCSISGINAATAAVGWRAAAARQLLPGGLSGSTRRLGSVLLLLRTLLTIRLPSHFWHLRPPFVASWTQPAVIFQTRRHVSTQQLVCCANAMLLVVHILLCQHTAV
jgi:hypothetical protein